MKLVVSRKPLRRILRWTQYVLIASAAAMLGYCGFVLADGWMFRNRESRQLERLLHDRKATNGAAPQSASPALMKNPPPAASGGLIGRIAIPRLGLSAIVMEGTDSAVLRRAAGHISGTALPGEPGNVGIAGHRDTLFRPLRNIRRDDIITLTTLLGEYRYRVVSTRIVSPNDVAVLNPSGAEILTLVTCYPFYFVGSAPHRFIVRAERVVLAAMN
jgi:sortase A